MSDFWFRCQSIFAMMIKFGASPCPCCLSLFVSPDFSSRFCLVSSCPFHCPSNLFLINLRHLSGAPSHLTLTVLLSCLIMRQLFPLVWQSHRLVFSETYRMVPTHTFALMMQQCRAWASCSYSRLNSRHPKVAAQSKTDLLLIWHSRDDYSPSL